ncbi:hypothetical protein SDC9_126084 [bioreactor metagenome]|uniref:Uncharacterized protein n=1 Tax=bioreactor metagenome TaxID=1076179 RepID=A0A645CQ53_9ZZZZ
MPLHRYRQCSVARNHNGLIGCPHASPSGGSVGHEGEHHLVLWIDHVSLNQQAGRLGIAVLQFDLEGDQTERVIERLVRMDMIDGDMRCDRHGQFHIERCIACLAKT